MNPVKSALHLCFALALVACGGGELSIDAPGDGDMETLELEFDPGELDEHPLPDISGGVPPYTSRINGCPGWVTFIPDQGVIAGTAPFEDSGGTFFCTYTVRDSSEPLPQTTSLGLRLVVVSPEPLDLPSFSFGAELTLKIGRSSQIQFPAASGGVEPYRYDLADCMLPDGLEFHPSTRILSGTPDAEYRGPNCTYRVTDYRETDSESPPMSVSRSFVLVVEPLEAGDWRFRTRTVDEPGGRCVEPGDESEGVATMPAAHGGEGAARYALPGAPHPSEPGFNLSFNPNNRVLTYTNPDPPPVLGTPNTYRYLVGTAANVDATNADDALCLDVQYVPRSMSCDDTAPLDHILITLQVRDDAFWDANAQEYRCPDTVAPEPRTGAPGASSNPVHEALGPVHARRASAVAHAAVRARVRGWSPGAERASFAITPELGLASLSGRSAGFDYGGTSESASFGAETGAGDWQAGLVASLTRTRLHYDAEASLADRGYRTGEHDTEILSLHPFAAWHAPSGRHFWASLGAGTGSLKHRDDLGFQSWSRSDVRLFAYAAGASVPVADVLSGELQAEAGLEFFALDIEGGGQISSSVPRLQGRDWRAGLAWSAPVSGAPHVAMAYRHLTGDGPDGGRLETQGSVTFAGIVDPRLSLTASAEASFAPGDREQSAWGLGGGVRVAPNGHRRGFGLDFDTHLVSPADDGTPGVRLRGEAGYGLSGGELLGTIRPYVKAVRHSGDPSIQRILGLDIRDTPNSRLNVEAQSRSRVQPSAVLFSLRHRF